VLLDYSGRSVVNANSRLPFWNEEIFEDGVSLFTDLTATLLLVTWKTSLSKNIGYGFRIDLYHLS